MIMKTPKTEFNRFIIIKAFCFLLATFITGSIMAQSNCAAPKDHGMGFSTSISSVIFNEDETYTITLRVKHNGCPGPECNSINHYSVEAGRVLIRILVGR